MQLDPIDLSTISVAYHKCTQELMEYNTSGVSNTPCIDGRHN